MCHVTRVAAGVLNVEFLSYNAIVMHVKIQIHELDLKMNTSI
jgi:hypothetical protein